MNPTRNETLAQFLERVAADTPVPGGGSVAAVAAALSASLGAMAARFTTGREKYREAEAEATGALKFLEAEASAFLSLADEDAAAYDQVDLALKLPKATPDEKAARAQALERALLNATRPPLEVARRGLDVADRLRRLRRIGNPSLVSDVGVAFYLGGAAIRGALLNVFVNLKSIKTEAVRAPIESEARALWRRLREMDGEAAAIATELAGAPLDSGTS